MTIITYRVRLQEPTILTSLSGEPNSSVTYDYIPGSVIRGLIIGLSSGGTEINAAEETMQRRFFNGQTRYLNAYIVNENQRSLPSPLSWQKPKYEAYIIRDNAFSPQNTDKPATKMKSVKDFVVIEGEGQMTDTQLQVYLSSPAHTLNVHNQRARRGGGEGTVYRYDALAKDQLFEGLIICDETEDAKWLETILTPGRVVMLGGARSAGYGQAVIEAAPKNETEVKVTSRLSNQKNPLTVTCLSDVILRNAQGEYEATLGSFLRAISPQLRVSQVARAFVDTVLVGGFNRKWGLPLPQTPALKMGSVIVFHQDVTLSDDRLKRLQHEGVGERTIDGFGRIAVNWLHLHEYKVHKPEKSETSNPSQLEEVILEGKADTALWQRLLTHRADQTTAQQLTQIYHDPKQQIQGIPPRTQLARLRHIIADELRKRQPSRQCLIDFLKEIAGKYADKKYEEAKIGSQSLKTWLREQANPSDEADRDLLKRIDAILEQAQKASKAKRSSHGQ